MMPRLKRLDDEESAAEAERGFHDRVGRATLATGPNKPHPTWSDDREAAKLAPATSQQHDTAT